MKRQDSIVYLSRVLWDGLYQRPQHLAAGLAQSFRVLYVDTPRSTFIRRFARPFVERRTVRPLLFRPSQGLTVLCPPYIPFLPKVWPPPFQYRLHRLFICWAARRLAMSTPIVWMSDPRDGYVLDSLSPRLLCYDCMDDYALIAPQAALRGVLRSQEEGLLKRVDVVFASSDELARRCTSSNRNVHLVPNGVDAARFAPASGAAIAPDVAALPRPRLGYAGSLASWIDFDLLAMIARARPQWSLVLVGPVASDAQAQVAALQRLANVHVLGERPYRAIPTYLHGFDVSLIPFQINDLTRAVNPVKFFEYIAAGQPVVATPLPELLRFQETCAIAASGHDFIACIESALSTRDDGERVRQRLAFAQANDWSQRVDSVRAALALALQSAGV